MSRLKSFGWYPKIQIVKYNLKAKTHGEDRLKILMSLMMNQEEGFIRTEGERGRWRRRQREVVAPPLRVTEKDKERTRRERDRAMVESRRKGGAIVAIPICNRLRVFACHRHNLVPAHRRRCWSSDRLRAVVEVNERWRSEVGAEHRNGG
ncbi:hypothetical protein PIB30_074285 [Stylosanthes scabra]|uniref:Uncharacterized protein n=1 Tax=Stylosanthes scabra TaxID=79078 RepID=A0ABU6QPN2_9FABA|nr:hypothetical protein [Stylosanthes scabra]